MSRAVRAEIVPDALPRVASSSVSHQPRVGVVVVRPGVDDGVRHVVVGKVEAVLAVEGELENLHAREARGREKGADVVVDRTEILGDDRRLAESAADLRKELHSRPFHPPAVPTAVGSPAFTSQYAAKPRKWSIRTMSARRKLWRRRSIHQPYPSVARTSQR